MGTSEKYTKKDGEQVKKTDWHRVVCWGALAKVANTYLKTGDLVGVVGKIHYRSYEDLSGTTRYVTEIQAKALHMLGGPHKNSEANPFTKAIKKSEPSD